jgi:ribulose-5-phosphate 4-epimerase/fuculose-1-phosphate aldolase
MTANNRDKQDLVDCIRMLERADYIDHNGHCSIRRDDVSFYINSGASIRSSLTVDDIVVVDLDGNLVEGTARQPLEYHIHSEIYRTRPDVNAVAHTHPKWSTFLTMTGHALKPIYAQGTLVSDAAVLDTPMSVNTRPMGEQMAAALGKKSVVLLKAHGAVATGVDILECFALAAYIEENAYRQYMAMQIGDLYEFSEEEQIACREKLWTPNLFRKTWDYYYAKLG